MFGPIKELLSKILFLLILLLWFCRLLLFNFCFFFWRVTLGVTTTADRLPPSHLHPQYSLWSNRLMTHCFKSVICRKIMTTIFLCSNNITLTLSLRNCRLLFILMVYRPSICMHGALLMMIWTGKM